MNTATATLLTCAAAALLAGCQDDKKAGTGTARGEVLPGSVSDAMLPLDTVRSQAPLAPRVETSGGAEKSGQAPAKPASAAPPVADQPAAAAIEPALPTPEAAE